MMAVSCVVALGATACERTESKTAQGSLAPVDAAAPTGTGWLHTAGNKILRDGRPFHGRGANIHDTRSCNACTFERPQVQEVNRRVDTLVDGWKANFIRLDLESYAAAEGRVAWKSALDDDAYLKDVQAIVEHVGSKPGTYVMLSVWLDPSLDAMGWPSDTTARLWDKLARTFASSPHVLFGVSNEPKNNLDGALDSKAWDAMNRNVAAIRAAEGSGPHHVVVVQGTANYARRLTYYVTHPITAGGGADVAYEAHIYDPKDKVDALLDGPAKTLPVIIGEFGPVTDVATMTLDDCAYLMKKAEEREVPYLAFTFHFRCPPNLLVDHSPAGCGVGSVLEPTDWGKQLKTRLATPW